MNLPEQRFDFSRKLIAIALLAALAPAHAEEASNQPESSVSAGLAVMNGGPKDRGFFGQYNGLKNDDAVLLLDADVKKRDDETGTWIMFQGRNLGLDSRDFNVIYQKQGDWKLSADYSELVRREPRTLNSSLSGAGTPTPTVTLLPVPGTGSERELEQKRKGVTVGADKWITPNLLFEASFKNEDKDGARLFGKGIACGAFSPSNAVCGAPPAPGGVPGLLAATTGAILLLPEPVNSTTQQLEAKLNYSNENFKLSGGYYGSFYKNNNTALSPTVIGGLVNPNGTPLATGTVVNSVGTTLLGILQQPVALPPDNEAHQLSLTGSYAFTPTTRANFKFAYTHATQRDDFTAFGAPAGFTNLGGVVNTTLAQAGLTARPTSALSLNANLRYEDRNDSTPYNELNPFTLSQNSWEKLTAKIEANYRLPDNYRATFGIDYQAIDRDRPRGALVLADPGLSALRVQTRELGYRLELRRSMTDTLTGAICVAQSKRDGDAWLSATLPGFPPVSDASLSGRNNSFPTTKEDRQRDKLKLEADWSATETLSLQFLIEGGKDKYDAPSDTGLRDTRVRNYGVDAVWSLSDAWKATGYLNWGDQTRHVNHSVGYVAELRDVSTSVGAGLIGKASGKLDVGANLTFINDDNRYQQSMSSGAPLVGSGLPDVTYRLMRLNVFGKYALEANSDVRVDLIHQRVKLDEWTWASGGVPFTYSDNTTVSLQQNQNVTYLGAAYIYKFK